MIVMILVAMTVNLVHCSRGVPSAVAEDTPEAASVDVVVIWDSVGAVVTDAGVVLVALSLSGALVGVSGGYRNAYAWLVPQGGGRKRAPPTCS